MNPLLLSKYFSNECTTDEAHTIEAWIRQSAENARVFNQLKRMWEETGAARHVAEHLQTEAAWQRVKARINTGQQAAPKWKRLSYVLPRAAAAILIFTSMVIFYLTDRNQHTTAVKMVEITTGLGERKQLALADGSTVWLNGGSTIKYPEQFEGDTREIYLDGEAYFKVEHNAQKPFMVHSEEVITRVLGTSFNVQAYPDDDKIIVALDEGKVRLTDENGQNSIELEPGTQAIFTRQGRQLQKEEITGKHNEWRNNVLHFDNTRLATAAKMLERWYGSKIVVENKLLENCRITAAFNGQTVDDALEIIASTLSVEIEKQSNNTFIIKGETCE